MPTFGSASDTQIQLSALEAAAQAQHTSFVTSVAYGQSYSATEQTAQTLADKVIIGDHTFTATQLGQLLNVLLEQHPEYKI